MEAYSNVHHVHNRTSHLTKLYIDAKKSALTSLEVQPVVTQQFSSLHRKYRIQKDRLITWGLAWSDDEKGPEGSIDESVARAGLTETVDSVLRNIKEVTDEAERIKAASLPGQYSKTGEKIAQPAEFDETRYEDLLNDLTASVDTLYDLSRSRKALARGEHPTFNTVSDEIPEARQIAENVDPKSSKAASIRRQRSRRPSYASSGITLVDPPPFPRPLLSPYAGLPPRIDVSALRLPEEGPPPYESLGVPSTTRLVARLIRARSPESVQNALGSSASEVPVLIEYANFDTIYRDTGVPPPLHRLEHLSAFLEPMRRDSTWNISLLGYVEDGNQPRIGLVYDLPYSIQNRLQGTVESKAEGLAPLSLLKLVQKATKAATATTDSVVPCLEDRYCMALRLTEQLHALHARGIAHGNINSSSVIFPTVDNDSSAARQKQLRSPLWASFDVFSKCSVEGRRRAFNLNIYKHPEDDPQNPGRSTSVDLKFDMYGLALLLLEIGLWTPVGDLYKAKYNLADFKLRLDKLWIPKLSARCGSAYMRSVQACVAAADDLDLSGSTTVIESAYETLMRSLQRCLLIDENLATDLTTPVDLFPENVMSSTIKRKPLPTEVVRLSRQQSEPEALQRTSSISSMNSSVSRLSSVPNFPADMTPVLERNVASPSIRSSRRRRESSSQQTAPSIPRPASPRFVTAPSMKEYKRKITLIQQTWREHRAQRSAAIEQAGTRAIEDTTIADASSEQLSKPKKKEFPRLELPQSVIDYWHDGTSIRLAKIVEKALKGSPESSSISLTAFGDSEETARPTLLVCCTSTAKVKHMLKRHFKFDPAICDVRVRKDEIRRCRKSGRRRKGDDAIRSMAPWLSEEYEKAMNPDYQERPLCGASIGAFRDDEHLPPVSFGGVVLIDGLAYGMSVHHMLEADDEINEDDEAGADDDSDASSIRSFDNISISSESDDDSTVRPPSTVPELMSSVDVHDGDCPGIVPGDFEEIAITQPALDDAIDLDLHVDEEEDDLDSGIDEDHLLSYKLGQVHASSGLKRTAVSLEGGFRSISQSLPQEIDWALFELVPPRTHPYNIVKGGRKFCTSSKGTRDATQHSYPVAIKTSSELACAKVHCLGRTSGLASGVISSTMELVKIHGRSTFSASWTVDGKSGVGGDSGAWVISNDDGKVCGHVLASRRGRTYICPMELLLEDIRHTLGAASVELPAAAIAEECSPQLKANMVIELTQPVAVDVKHEESVAEAVPSLRIGDRKSGSVPEAVKSLRIGDRKSGNVPLATRSSMVSKSSMSSTIYGHLVRSLGTAEAAG